MSVTSVISDKPQPKQGLFRKSEVNKYVLVEVTSPELVSSVYFASTN